MFTRNVIAAIASAGLALAPGVLSSQVLTGIVREDSAGRPLAGVDVSLEGTKLQASTDSAGRYAFQAPGGTRIANFRSPGYQPLRMRVTVRGDTVHADATLVRVLATQLEVVKVNAPGRLGGTGREGFAERRAMGIGAFIDSSALRVREDRRLEDVLRELTAVRFQEFRDPQSSIVEVRAISPTKQGTPDVAYPMSGDQWFHVAGVPACWVSVFLNGSPIYRSDATGAGRPPDFSRDFSVASLESIEYYKGAAEVPPQFGGSRANCGALVMWTRR